MNDGAPTSRAHQDLMHELRTPLTIVIGRMQLLRRRQARGQKSAAQVAADLEALEAVVIRLAAAVDRVDGRGPFP